MKWIMNFVRSRKRAANRKTATPADFQAEALQSSDVKALPIAVRDIFRPVGTPTVTLIDRSVTKEYREIEFYLADTGGLVSVHGDSKSGKTTLCLNILKPYNPILLHGRIIDSEQLFWDAISAKLDLAGRTEKEEDQEEKRSKSTKIKGGFGSEDYLLKVGGEHNRGNEEIRGSKTKVVYARTLQQVLDELIASKRPLVIDDFHSVPKDIQQKIVFNLKPAIDQGITVVVISIPEETKEILQGMQRRGEAIGRHATILAPLWKPAEISQIPAKGFAALNVSIDQATVETLTKFSYRNPLLMQHYCARLCFELGIRAQSAVRKQFVVDADVIRSVISSTAAQYETSFSDYLSLEGGRDANWKLDTSDSVNIYVLILLAISGIAIMSPVKLATIKDRIAYILADDVIVPSEAVIHNALAHLTKRMATELGYDAVFRYDEQNKYAYITHPFFKVFLQWSLLPKYVGVYPRTKLVPEELAQIGNQRTVSPLIQRDQ